MVDPLVAAPAAVYAGIGVVGLAREPQFTSDNTRYYTELSIIRADESVDKIEVRGFG